MPRRLVAVRTKGDIYHVICQQQTRALKMLPRIEPNSHGGRSVSANPRDRGCYGNRAIHSFLAAGKIERMDIEHRRTLVNGFRHHVQYAALQIDYRRAEDSYFERDIVVTDERSEEHTSELQSP